MLTYLWLHFNRAEFYLILLCAFELERRRSREAAKHETRPAFYQQMITYGGLMSNVGHNIHFKGLHVGGIVPIHRIIVSHETTYGGIMSKCLEREYPTRMNPLQGLVMFIQ